MRQVKLYGAIVDYGDFVDVKFGVMVNPNTHRIKKGREQVDRVYFASHTFENKAYVAIVTASDRLNYDIFAPPCRFNYTTNSIVHVTDRQSVENGRIVFYTLYVYIV